MKAGSIREPGQETELSDESIQAFWFFTTETCLTCQDVDHAFRKLQHEYGNLWSLHAIHIGRIADTTFSAGFLRRFGIKADLFVLSPTVFEHGFGGRIADPSIIVLNGDRIEVFNAPIDLARLVDFVEGLLDTSRNEREEEQ